MPNPVGDNRNDPAAARPPPSRTSAAQLQRLLDKLPAGAYTCDEQGLITYFNSAAQELWGRAPRLNHAADRYCGSLRLFAGDGRPLRHDQCWMALALKRKRGYSREEIVIERPDGSRITVLANVDPIRDADGAVTGAINVFQDVTDRKAAEQTVRSLLKLSEKLHATLDLETLLEALVQESMALIGAEGGCAGWCAAAGMVCRRYFGRQGPIDFDGRWRHGEGLPGWLLAQRAPYLTNDAAADPQIAPEFRRRFAIESALATPALSVDGRVLGFVELHNKKGGFTAADVELSVAVARIAAIAMQNALAHQQVVRAESGSRESDERFARFMQHLPGLAWIKDAQGRYIYVNDGAEKAFGRPRDQISGRTDEQIFAPDTAARFRQNDRAAVDSPGGVQTTESLRHPDGELHDSLVSKFGIPAPDGGPPMIGGMAIDITDRRRAEERFRFLAEMMPSLTWTAAPDGSITYANKRWVEYCGISPEQNVSDWPELVQHPDDRARCQLEWTMALHDGREFEVEVRNRRHDGVYRWFMTRAVPMKDPQGRVLSWFGVTIDIHDLKEAQEQLRISDRRKDEFLATLAHELRNPLAPLSLAAQMLARGGGLDARSGEMISMMQRQVDHMVRLIDDLMEISRVSRGKIELRRGEVDLHSVLDNSVELARPHIEAAQHRLELSFPDQPVRLYADPVRLAQIVANLLNNAAKYTPEGGCVALSAQRAGGEVVIRVRDDGAGISPEALPHIFNLFAQGDRAPISTQGGLGIGLSLAKGLAELHGGSIGAHSDGIGFGSEFTVRIPIRPPPPAKAAERSSAPEAGAARGARVLVVDDNKSAATMLGLALETLGASVRVVYDGAAAVAAAAEFRPAIVFMDIGMPGLDGLEAAPHIRAAGGAGMLLVAVSGWGQAEVRSRTSAAGFDKHLVKPVELAQLRAILAGRAPA